MARPLTEMVYFRCDDETKKALQDYAAELGFKNVSDIVRVIVKRQLELRSRNQALP